MILIVEDEVLVRMAVAEFLRSCGYRVVEAGDAGEALVVLEAKTPIELVFTDIQLPGDMDGFGLAQWVRQHRPGVRVILTSGHENAAKRANEVCLDGPVLPKPYDPHAVLREIGRQLARQGG